MKKLSLIFALAMALLFTANINDAQAQQRANVGQALSGLINVNVGNVQVDASDLIDVDVENVLNNNQIDILRNAIQNNPIASNNQNFLNDLLREAELITDNQIVIGVLSGGILLIDNL